jgi:hypothetical protein
VYFCDHLQRNRSWPCRNVLSLHSPEGLDKNIKDLRVSYTPVHVVGLLPLEITCSTLLLCRDSYSQRLVLVARPPKFEFFSLIVYFYLSVFLILLLPSFVSFPLYLFIPFPLFISFSLLLYFFFSLCYLVLVFISQVVNIWFYRFVSFMISSFPVWSSWEAITCIICIITTGMTPLLCTLLHYDVSKSWREWAAFKA